MRVGEGRYPFYINHEIYLKHFSIVHCSFFLLFEGGGLDFAQDEKSNFYLKFNCLK